MRSRKKVFCSVLIVPVAILAGWTAFQPQKDSRQAVHSQPTESRRGEGFSPAAKTGRNKILELITSCGDYAAPVVEFDPAPVSSQELLEDASQVIVKHSRNIMRETSLITTMSDQIAPGMPVRGKSFDTGTIDPIRGDFLTGMEFGVSNAYGQMPPEIRSSPEMILGWARLQQAPAHYGIELMSATNLDHLMLKMGTKFSFFGSTLNNKFDFSQKKNTNSLFVVIRQNVFSIDVDGTKSLSELVNGSNGVENLVAELNGDRSPILYVSKVVYGKTALLQVTAEGSMQEVKNVLEATILGQEATLSAELKKVASTATAQLLVYGGDPTIAAQLEDAATEDQSTGYLQRVLGMAKTYMSPEATCEHVRPVGFELRSLLSNRLVASRIVAPAGIQKRMSPKWEWLVQMLRIRLRNDGDNGFLGDYDGDWHIICVIGDKIFDSGLMRLFDSEHYRHWGIRDQNPYSLGQYIWRCACSADHITISAMESDSGADEAAVTQNDIQPNTNRWCRIVSSFPIRVDSDKVRREGTFDAKSDSYTLRVHESFFNGSRDSGQQANELEFEVTLKLLDQSKAAAGEFDQMESMDASLVQD